MKKTYKAFSAGEISEDVRGRYDIDKYGTGCSILKNAIIMAQGGVFKRPGSKFIAASGDSTKKVRLIPFEFSTTQPYVLEFGHQYMRVLKDGGQVLETAKNITAISQANPGVVTSNAHGYANGKEVYIIGVGGMTALNGRSYKVAGATTNTFTLVDMFGNPVNTTALPAYTSGGTVAAIYQIATTYTETELFDLYFAQTADVMTIVHPDHKPAELTRTGHAAWTMTDITFAPKIAAPASATAVNTVGSGGIQYQYVVTAVMDETYEESLPSVVASVFNNLATSGNYNTISYPAVVGAVKYNIYKSELGTYGFIGTVETLSFKDDNIDPDIANTPPKARNPFSTAGNYPSVVSFQQQRRVFAATKNKPDTIFMSRAGQYSNMSVSIPNKDDDAITFAIASGQVNKIEHLVPFRDQLAMTSGSEWKITAQGGYTPTSMEATPETNYGTEKVKPILIGNTAIFNELFGYGVRDYSYTFEADGYDGNDLSILSKHLLEDRYIADWAFASQPNRVIWAVMTDGKMCSLTYMREHKVWGWARQETDGFVESVCVIPDRGRRQHDVYFLIRRTINGVDYRYIERLEKYIDKDVKDSYFVDCGLSYSGTPISVVRNLWHLEGRTATILADGSVVGTKVVSGGQVTLDVAAAKIHVGLFYDSELQPLPTESDQGEYGSTIGEPKRLRSVVAQVIRTRGLEAGQAPDDQVFGRMVPKFPELDMSQTIETYTGTVEFSVQSRWADSGVSPYIVHRVPLPFKILSLTPDYA